MSTVCFPALAESDAPRRSVGALDPPVAEAKRKNRVMTPTSEPVMTPGNEPGAPPDAGRQRRRKRRIEIAATVLLSAATVLTAWSAFQATKWSGVQAIAFSRASASRTESVRDSTAAGQQSIADVSMFVAWLTATDQGQTRLADLLAKRFRGEFKVAFDAWEATNPLKNPSAPATPFAMPEYRSASARRAGELEALATTQFKQATDANQRSDNYVLMTVLFAVVLFFGAVSTQLELASIQISMLGVAAVVFIASVAITSTFPVKL